LTVALPEEETHMPSTSNLSQADSYTDVDEPFLSQAFLPSAHILGQYP
jgi:hypothetical protein